MFMRSFSKMISTQSETKFVLNSIEGNIACGKSTILDYLSSKKDNNLHCIQEPISEWTNMKSGADLLKLFYEENDKWTFSFENLVQLSRLKSCYEASKLIKTSEKRKQNENKIYRVFLERSIHSSYNVFTLNSYEENKLNQVEYDILTKYYQVFNEKINKQLNCLNKNFQNHNIDLEPFQIIYIRTSPEVCFNRLKRRNRISENEIDLTYLIKIHLKYENWINKLINEKKMNVNIIDGNCDRNKVLEQIENLSL